MSEVWSLTRVELKAGSQYDASACVAFRCGR